MGKKAKSDIIISNEIGRKIFNKKYLLQFCPEVFQDIKDLKYVLYNDKKIKTDYLIDLVNSLLLKYYFKKINLFTLSSKILKDKYGYLYNYYIDYLLQRNILIKLSEYKKGISSRKFKLNENIINSNIKRYKNDDKIILKKYKKRIFNSINFDSDQNELIPSRIKQKLINDLFSVEINYKKSSEYLKSYKEEYYDLYNRNMYSLDCIKNGDIFYHFDNYGRMHTNFTILKSFIRKNFLTIDGEETYEIDIANSQPLFLTKLMIEKESEFIYGKDFERFQHLTINGLFYQYIKNKLNIEDKNEAKKITYKVLFGRNTLKTKNERNFKKLFPSIFGFIQDYKIKHNNYKILAYDLQKLESNLIFNKIINLISNIDPSVKIITIHDSIIVSKKHKDKVSEIFYKKLKKEIKPKQTTYSENEMLDFHIQVD